MLSNSLAIMVMFAAALAAAPVEHDLVGSWRLTAPDQLQRGIVDWRPTLSPHGKLTFVTRYSRGNSHSETGRWRIHKRQLVFHFQNSDEQRPRRPDLIFDILSFEHGRILARYGPWDVVFERTS
jgi:hypothetical protein